MFQVFSTVIRQEKVTTGIIIGKEKLNFFLFADAMSLYLKDTVDSNQKTFRCDKHLQDAKLM